MKNFFKFFQKVVIITVLSFAGGSVFLTSSFADIVWAELKGEHFIAEYDNHVKSSLAKKVLQKAEFYYRKIASTIGYSRYDNYWTWDNRAKIIIYENKKSFVLDGKQPPWAVGASFHDERFSDQRTIITFPSEEDFIDGVLPHEIGHLILRDFIGRDKNLPLWFEEGVAQLQEVQKKYKANRIMRQLISLNREIPLSELMQMSLQQAISKDQIQILYAQSVSVVDFLLQSYGSQKFIQLCKLLRDGKEIKEAIEKIYNNNFSSLDGMEKKWIEYILK